MHEQLYYIIPIKCMYRIKIKKKGVPHYITIKKKNSSGIFTCFNETSYSSSQPPRAFSKDEIFLYLFFSSARGHSLEEKKKNEVDVL